MRIHSMISRKASRGSVAGAVLLTVLLGLAMSANTQAVVPSAFSPGPQFAEKSGEELFTMVCQSCHMPDGKGAAGAGAYPPLADNKNLVTSGYPIATVLNGQRAMPPFGAMMSDEQVAAVVNYVRTHFGNHYGDAVTAEDVRPIRR
jgi:mono/diheme cytochrome c family protein